MENIRIKILTIQTIDKAGNEDEIELMTEATLEKVDDHFVVNYDESHISNTKGNKTRLKIYENKLHMTKLGEFSSKMEFETGKIYKNIYTTPYGSFDLDFQTDTFINNLDENGKGTLFIDYKIIFGKMEENYNKLKIEIF
ncbi:MAG: DUF1934 domain-containing protein [Tissierellia bacterium]|nr:DUF1934 domain-containing protein [Tissierellia bacterium]MDD4781544.1 DUF1934 domain-containing protein [Tissierellia bacterium]